MAPPLVRWAMAAASGVAVTSAASAEDAEALIQVAAAHQPRGPMLLKDMLQLRRRTEDDVSGCSKELIQPGPPNALYTPPSRPSAHCRCLNWKEVYTEYGVACGQTDTPEFWFLPDKRKLPGLIADMCSRFYTQYNDNHCIQEIFDGRSREEWCYVSSQCMDLRNGAHVLGTDVSWKTCYDKEDKTLRKENPRGLLRIALNTNMDPAYMMKMAYPVWDVLIPGFHWPGVEESLGLRERHGQYKDKVEYLHKIEELHHPWIVDSYDGHPPYGYIDGTNIIECDMSDWYWKTVSQPTHVIDENGRETDDIDHYWNAHRIENLLLHQYNISVFNRITCP